MGVVAFIIYALIGKLVYELLQRRQGGDTDVESYDDKLNVFFAIIWPLTILGLLRYMVDPTMYWGSSAPRGFSGSWKAKPRVGGDYNADNIGKEREYDTEDMEAFIQSLQRRPDAPLSDELTFSYKPTGISRTYPVGTPFPSTLVNDWKRGFFMGGETSEHIDS